MLREKCIGLLALWCEKLLSLQYRNTGKKSLMVGYSVLSVELFMAGVLMLFTHS